MPHQTRIVATGADARSVRMARGEILQAVIDFMAFAPAYAHRLDAAPDNGL